MIRVRRNLALRQWEVDPSEIVGEDVIVGHLQDFDKLRVKAGKLERISKEMVRVDGKEYFFGQGHHPERAILDIKYFAGNARKKQKRVQLAYVSPYYTVMYAERLSLARGAPLRNSEEYEEAMADLLSVMRDVRRGPKGHYQTRGNE